MKWDLKQRPTRHSYSSLKLYKQCPAAYAYNHIAKMPTASTGAMDRGTRLHKLCEDYVLDKSPEVACPYDVRKIGLKLYKLRMAGAKAEETWLLDNDWEPTEDPSHAKLKAIIDVHHMDKGVLKIHDYKSGREYPEHSDQLELYGLIGLRRFPDAKRVEASAIYIDSGNESQPRSILHEMFPHYVRRWASLVGQLDSESRFLPTAGVHCGRCDYRASAGGPCQSEWKKP